MEYSHSSSACRADFFDASALVRLYVDEPEYEKVRTYFNNSSTKYTTPFCFYETLSILKGKWTHNKLTREKYITAVLKLTAWYSASSSQISDLDFTSPDLIRSASAIVEAHNIDFSDAFQILSIRQGYFAHNCGESQTVLITADKGLADAARALGLKVWNVLEKTK